MNHEKREALELSTEGMATVTIRNYSINYAHQRYGIRADLVKAEISPNNLIIREI